MKTRRAEKSHNKSHLYVIVSDTIHDENIPSNVDNVVPDGEKGIIFYWNKNVQYVDLSLFSRCLMICFSSNRLFVTRSIFKQ